MTDAPTYQGGSGFLRWWPRTLLGLAALVVVLGVARSLPWAALFVLVALLHSWLLPCQFTILDEGLAPLFPFGRRVLLPKQTLTIRMDDVGALAFVGRHRHSGYPLLDRILYEPGRSLLLRTAFAGLGYRFT
jgi:hypothetical protein